MCSSYLLFCRSTKLYKISRNIWKSIFIYIYFNFTSEILFKKDKYVDQDNTEWAKYYLNQLVGRIKPYEKVTTPDKGAWDINKYGLSAYLTGQGLNARDIFEKYDLRDKDNPEAARSFTQRREILKKHLAGYNNWLKGKGFDFSKNDNEWDDTFGTDLDKFVTDYDNLDNNTLAT